MTLTRNDKLDILWKNRVIYQMCLEDLELCKDMRVRPAFVRFPECFDFSVGGYINEKRAKSQFTKLLNNISGMINILYRIDTKKANEFIENRKKLLELHLEKLKEQRELRKKILEDKSK
jgi:hypothetical protein